MNRLWLLRVDLLLVFRLVDEHVFQSGFRRRWKWFTFDGGHFTTCLTATWTHKSILSGSRCFNAWF